MRIGNQEIGLNHPPYIIAEIGVNHDGDVQRALELTDAAAEAGADAIKLQFFETDRLMSKAAKLAAYQKTAGETDPIEMLRRLELTIDEMALVVERAHSKGIHAIVTVFSAELVPIAETLPWDAYKTASPDIINKPLLEALMHTGKPLIVSTGASTMDEVVQAVDWLDSARDRLAILQCVSSYPAPESSYEGIPAIAKATKLPTGYSDHSLAKDYAHFPVCAGACILEKHITDDRTRQGPDHRASILVGQLSRYIESANSGVPARSWVERVRNSDVFNYNSEQSRIWAAESEFPERSHKCLGWAVAKINPKKTILDCEQDVRQVARQSITSTQDIPAGTILTKELLTIKRPGTGILAFNIEAVIGCTTSQPIEADVPINESDLVQFEPLMAIR